MYALTVKQQYNKQNNSNIGLYSAKSIIAQGDLQ